MINLGPPRKVRLVITLGSIPPRTFMKFFSSLLLAACCLAPSLPAQVWVGGDAPDFEAKAWFNEPAATNIGDLHGKVVFIEFWATW